MTSFSFDRTPPGPTEADEPLSRYRFGSHINLRTDATIFKFGDPVRRFYRVISGVVRCYVELPDGRRQVTDFLFGGDLFGFQRGATYSVTAEAVTNVTLAVYSLNPRGGLPVGISPEASHMFLTAVTARLAGAREQMVLLGRKTAEERLATFILQLAEHMGSDDGTWIKVPMTRGDIGDHLGMTLETVCRMFRSLREKHIIALPSASEVRVLDRAALESLANGEGDVTGGRGPGDGDGADARFARGVGSRGAESANRGQAGWRGKAGALLARGGAAGAAVGALSVVVPDYADAFFRLI